LIWVQFLGGEWDQFLGGGLRGFFFLYNLHSIFDQILRGGLGWCFLLYNLDSILDHILRGELRGGFFLYNPDTILDLILGGRWRGGFFLYNLDIIMLIPRSSFFVIKKSAFFVTIFKDLFINRAFLNRLRNIAIFVILMFRRGYLNGICIGYLSYLIYNVACTDPCIKFTEWFISILFVLNPWFSSPI